MNIAASILIVSTVITLSQGCFVVYFNRIEKQSVNTNLSAWTALIVKKIDSRYELSTDALYYGSIIHPQAVLLLNSTILYGSTINYRIVGGCWAIRRDSDRNVDDCQFRNISRIINGRITAEEASNDNNSYAIVILNSPFNLNDGIKVINLAINAMNEYSNCYIYAPAVLSIMNDSYSYTSLLAPYRAEIVDNSARMYKHDGVNYTHIIEDINLNVNHSGNIFVTLEFRGSPLVCQKNNTDDYEQIGLFNLDADPKKPFEQQRSELFINTTAASEEIYATLHHYFMCNAFWTQDDSSPKIYRSNDN